MSLFPRFVSPWMLLLLLAVPWSVWIGLQIHSLAGARKWTAVTLRCIILVCLIGALAGAEIVRINDDLAVFFVLDHSNSVSEDARLRSAQEIRSLAEEFMTRNDKVGVIVFGDEASIELSVDETLGLRDIDSVVGGEQTDLSAAVRLAMAAFPQGHMRRIVLITDGNETRGSALEEVKIARAAGVAVDVVPLRREPTPEVRIREVRTPSQSNAGEPFQLQIVVEAEQDSEATVRIVQRSGDERRMLPPQQVTLQKGDNTFILTQELQASGFYEYEVSIESDSDTVAANNQGRAYTIIQGEPRVLYVDANPANSAYLRPALEAEGIRLVATDPGGVPSSLAQLQNYDAVILADVSATLLSREQLQALEAMVRDLGIGLVMIGGPDSFGAGGYLDTPVEKALPVDMDIKQRKVMPKGALVLILHTVEFPDGNAWAAEIAIAALNVLSSYDLMGGLGYMHSKGDSWIFPISPVGNKVAIRDAIRAGSTQIGDMPSVDGTLRMAYAALTSGEAATAAAKRVLIISDGDPAAPTSNLVGQIRASGISVSTVVINPHSQNDLTMMRSLAEDTGGQFYYVTNPNNLPQIFTKEASIVKRGMIIEDSFEPRIHHDSELLYGLAESAMPNLNGYVVTTPKDEATVPLLSHEGDPILAHFRYGLGKSVAFTSDATNRWATEWLAWEGFDRFWAQTIRWATRDLSPTNFQVETSVRNGRGHVRVDAVDPEGNFINFLRPKGVVTSPAPDYDSSELVLNQTGPGIYEGSFPLGKNGVYMINLLYTKPDGTQGSIPAGLSLGYSPEYEYTNPNIPLLEQIASAGGGQLAAAGYNPFVHDLIATPAVTPIWHVLALIAACLFPIEIFVRRVVIPLSVITDPIVRLLKRLPALGTLIPAPPPRPVAVTGSYSAAVEARDFDGPAMEGAPAFGQTETPTANAPSAAPAAASTPAAEKAQESSSGYTGQLLAAKERAIARKTRRISSLDDKNKL